MERQEINQSRSAARARRRKQERKFRIICISFCICLLVVIVAGVTISLFVMKNQQAADNSNVMTESNIAENENLHGQNSEKSIDEILEELLQALQNAENIDESIYTDESLQNLEQVYQEAKAMMSRKTYTKEELVTVKDNMLLALQSLQGK